jgi:hypothetical protein
LLNCCVRKCTVNRFTLAQFRVSINLILRARRAAWPMSTRSGGGEETERRFGATHCARLSKEVNCLFSACKIRHAHTCIHAVARPHPFQFAFFAHKGPDIIIQGLHTFCVCQVLIKRRLLLHGQSWSSLSVHFCLSFTGA